MPKRYTVETIFTAVDRVTAPLKRMEGAVGKVSRSLSKMGRGVARSFDSMAKQSAVAGAAVGVTAFKIMQTGAEFEQAIVNTTAKYGDLAAKGTDTYNALADAAKRAGATTEFTATAAAEALNFLAMAGFNAEEAIQALPTSIDLATVAQMGLAESTDIASDALGQFNLGVGDLPHLTDVFVKAATTSNTTVRTLFETFRQAGAVGTQFGGDLHSVAAMTGVLGSSSIKAEKAGTGLKALFLRLTTPTGEAADTLRALNVELESGGKIRPIFDRLESLQKGLEGLDEAAKANALKTIFGEEALPVVLLLLQKGSGELRAYAEQLKNADGASAKMAATMRDTLLGRFKGLMSALEGVAIAASEKASPAMTKFVDGAVAFVRANGPLISGKVGEALQQVGEFAKDAGPPMLELAKDLGAVFKVAARGLKVIAQLYTDTKKIFEMRSRTEKMQEKNKIRDKIIAGEMFNPYDVSQAKSKGVTVPAHLRRQFSEEERGAFIMGGRGDRLSTPFVPAPVTTETTTTQKSEVLLRTAPGVEAEAVGQLPAGVRTAPTG